MTAQEWNPGIGRTDIYNIRFYEKSPFNGSYLGMHYRIERICDDENDKRLLVTIWPGPYNFDHTDEALKVTASFNFTNEGLDEITEYLNRYYQDHFT